MACAATYDITCNKAGDTWKGLTFTYDRDGVFQDLTNYAIKMQVKTSGNEILLDLSIGFGITLTDAVNGVFTIDPILTPNAAGTNYYDIEFTNAGIVSTYVKGKFTIESDITR